MHVRVEDFVRVLQLPSGRTSFATRAVLEAATRLQATSIVDEAEKTLEAAAGCRNLELRYRKPVEKPLHGEGAPEKDAVVDRTLTSFHGLALSIADLLPPDHPKGIAARSIVDDGFPRGVAPITRLSYVEEVEAVMGLIERFTKGDLKAAIQALDFGPFVERLGVVAESLAQELGKPEPDNTPTWDEVRAARATMHTQLTRLIAVICGSYPHESDDATRSELLGPIAAQQEQLRARYRARLGALDVDPQTGQEQPDPPLVEDPIDPTA